MSVGSYFSRWGREFADAVMWVFVPQPFHKDSQDAVDTAGSQDEAVAMETFRHRLSSHRSTDRYTHRAPDYDYMNWKPVGTVRDEQPPHAYAQTCKSLGTYVRGVMESGIEGYQEKMWVGVTGRSTGISRPPSQPPSRAASTEQLLNISRERF